MEALTIGQLARQAAVGVETIRFYEREGLLAEPERRPSGYRQYPAEVVRRVRFIRHAKELGFTLKEIQELLELRVDPVSSCADVRRHARAKIADIGAHRITRAHEVGRFFSDIRKEKTNDKEENHRGVYRGLHRLPGDHRPREPCRLPVV